MAVKNVSLTNLGNVLQTPFMTPKSKNLIKSGWRGDINEFSKRLNEYRWFGTRDYTMAVIMLTVVVASSKVKDIKINAKQRDVTYTKLENDKNDITLSDYINIKVGNNRISKLFEKIVNIENNRNSHNIADAISREDKPHGWFAKCFTKLSSATNSDQKKVNDVFKDFLKQVKKMTKWRINKSYMSELTNVINSALSTNITPSSQTEPEPETTETQIEQLDKEKDELKEYVVNTLKIAEPRHFIDGGSFYMKNKVGWKLHISPKPAYVMKAIEALQSIEQKYKCQNKFVSSLANYKKMNGNQSGKFITIYPESDEQANQIAKSFHEIFVSKGLASDSCFINVKNDFKVYPGIYTRFCDYLDRGYDRYSRYTYSIPKETLECYLQDLNKSIEEYEHPFESLSFGGLQIPKKVSEINNYLSKEFLNKIEWEPLTDPSEIPDDDSFTLDTLRMGGWFRSPIKDFVAIAKIKVPGYSQIRIFCVPKDVSKYKFVISNNDNHYRQILKNLLDGKKQNLGEFISLVNEYTKKDIQVEKDPQSFFKTIKKQLKL